jgi:hypothetical protein
MNEVKLHVGDIDDMGKRFIDAWKRLENGQKVEERHLSFFSLDAMMATLSQKRLEILKHLHRHQEKKCKYPDGTISEIAHDRNILLAALTILEGCYELHAGVKLRIDDAAQASFSRI